jgi:hypothetical protein
MRIRKICASALLTVGLSWGAGDANAQPWPAPVPGAYPPGYGSVAATPGYPYDPASAKGAVPPGTTYYANPYFYPGYQAYSTDNVAPSAPATPTSAPKPASPAPVAVQPTALPGPAAAPAPAPVVAQPTTLPASEGVVIPSEPVIRYVGQQPVIPMSKAPPFVALSPADDGAPLIGLPPLDGPLGTDAVPPPHDHPLQYRPNQDHCWISAQYVMGFFRQQHLTTPLVTTGSLTDISPGALGSPGTAILFGDSIDPGMFSGVRLGAGFFMDNSGQFSLDGEGLYFAPKHDRFARNSDPTGVPLITRPFFNVLTGTNAAFFDAFPATAAGGVAIDSRTQFWGYEVNTRYHCCLSEHCKVDFLFGYRQLRLDDDLKIDDTVMPLVPGALTFRGMLLPATSTLTDFDSFRTTNNFYGLQLGTRFRWESDWLFVSAFGKVGLGATVQRVTINGQTTVSDPVTGIASAEGGILALPSNIGSFRRTNFGIVPEGGLNVGLNVTPHVRLTAGYSFLLWNQVVRPGNQISPSINPTQVPSAVEFGTIPATPAPTAPLFRFNGEYFWIHSFNVGVDIHF